MTKQLKTIPVGYQAIIHSWENDLDACETKIISGLTKEAAVFIKDFTKLFVSTGQESKYGANLYTDYGDDKKCDAAFKNLEIAFKKILKDNREGVIDLFKTVGYDTDEIDSSGDDLHDLLTDMVYEFLGASETYLFRVFDHIEVYYIHSEIKEVEL